MIALELAVIDPAVAAKVALDEPAAMMTEAGTGRSGLLLERAIEAAPVSTVPESVTVQVVDCPEFKLAGLQASRVNVSDGATSWMTTVRDTSLSLPVMVAVPVAETVPAVALKFAVALPAGTDTEAGVD